MSFPTILRRSFPTWLLLTVPLAAAAPPRGRRTRRCRSRGPRSPPASPAASSSPSAASPRTAATRPARTLTRSPGTRGAGFPTCPLGRPRGGREREWQRLCRRRLRRRPQPARHRFRARFGRDLAPPPGAARRRAAAAAAIAGGKLRPRRRRRPPRARPRRVRARPEDAPLGAAPRSVAARASRGGRSRHARLRARRPQRGDRHEHEPVRGLRRAGAAVDAARTYSAGPRRHRSGLCEREDLLDRRRAPAGHDRVGLHVRAADEALAAPPRPPDSAPRARGRRRRGRVWVVAGGPQPGLTVSGAVESIRP